MVPHAETVCQFGLMHHHRLQSEANRARLAARAPARNRGSLTDFVRRLVSSALQSLRSRASAPRHIASREPIVATRPGFW